MATLCPLSMQVIYDNNGILAPGAKLKFFQGGTTTPKPVYADPDLTIPLPDPLICTASGRVPGAYFTTGLYKIRIITDDGVQIDEFDDIDGAPVPYIPPDVEPGTVIPTGFMIASDTDFNVSGWVIANGQTVGNASSSASYAAENAEQLFKQRWNKLPALGVVGGRGASANADWLAGKSISVPDLRGCVFVGRDIMSGGVAGRITAATCTNPDQNGFLFGVQTVSLTEAQLAVHDHDATTAAAGQHDHDGSVTDVQGNHTHPYNYATYTAEAVTTAGGPGRQSLVQVNDQTGGAGSHGHNLAILNDGSHVHVVDVADAGSGAAHSNVQPSVLTTIYIKL